MTYATSALETECQSKKTLLRFARVQAWGSALSGTAFLIAAPLLAAAESAGAPLAREFAMLLLAMGIGCILFARSARRDAALLKAQLHAPDFLIWTRSLAMETGLGTQPAKPGSTSARRPLQAA